LRTSVVEMSARGPTNAARNYRARFIVTVRVCDGRGPTIIRRGDRPAGREAPALHVQQLAEGVRAVQYSDDPVEQAIMSQPGLTGEAKDALVKVYRVLLHHKRP
jgi:hypothetical protein